MTDTISATVKTADWKSEKHVPAIAAPAPSARFRVSLSVPGVLHATAYCNLHGLWTSAALIAVA